MFVGKNLVSNHPAGEQKENQKDNQSFI